MRKCEKCNSIWVRWNDTHLTKEFRKRMNPWNKNPDSDIYGHNCLCCRYTLFTKKRIKTGFSDIFIKLFGGIVKQYYRR